MLENVVPMPPVSTASTQAQAAHAAHAERVAKIAADVRSAVLAKETVYIWKGGVHHFVPLPGDKRFAGRRIDVSSLNNILEIDVGRRRCIAEPGVTFADLVQATLPLGLVPKVEPELEDITHGGAVAGCSVESMSYRYGGFHDGCDRYEVVTGVGEIRSLARGEELFEMIHGSYGTLSILTELRFDLVPALPFVHMTYRKLPTGEAFWSRCAPRSLAAISTSSTASCTARPRAFCAWAASSPRRRASAATGA